MSKTVYAPVRGTKLDITEVKDPVFAEKILGDGMAVIPEDDWICAPIAGRVKDIFPANHAFTMEDDEGNQFLVHIGLETVNLQGKYFRRLVKVGDLVEQGTPVIRADMKKIKKKGYDPVVIVVLAEGKISRKMQTGEGAQEKLFTVD